MSHKLRNYLRTYRRRAGLSQDEMAFLLGAKSGSKVSRYERFTRQPTLHTVFAYEAVFHVPARDLFAGNYQNVERETRNRMRALTRRLRRKVPSRETAHKLVTLKSATEKPQ